MSQPTKDGAPDYRASLFLPATDFPMKAGLPEAEPKWLQRWAEIDLYGKMRDRARGRPLFVLHDGPIYANGDIHSGTGLNHILKDFVVRSQGMLGKDAPYVPGWDCHGLPIEWKVEEQYRAEGKSKDDVPTEQLRRDCRVFASHWLNVQREQIKRLGQIGDFERPYTTMNFRAEAVIAREAMKFVENGLLYRGFRPVMWSPVEKTALADAEVEYHEKSSPQIYVKFPIAKGELEGGFVVIWTTTPWTIPGNRAVAFSPEISYGLYQIADAADGSLARAGEQILLADLLAEDVAKQAKMMLSRVRTVEQGELAAIVCAHPFRSLGYDFEVPLLAGAHVTADTGTGFVHTAPGHGEDDFELMTSTFPGYAAQNPDAFSLVEPDGSYGPKVPHFAGKRILTPEGKDGDANGAVIKTLIEKGKLLAKGNLRHSYPHSWRSKAPVIFRATPQWFVAIDKPFLGGKSLRELAMKAIGETKWYPPRGQNRIGSMVESRPDWVLSRQRAWGVPLAIFVEKKTGQVLNDPAVFARIEEAFIAEGADAWFTSPPGRFLGEGRDANDYEQVKDILDVWFDSGSTHVFTVENPIDPHWPKKEQADLYLEGSDQHRGWFQSSLLEAVGTTGRAPYKGVLTHGFVLDDQGRKMSKSLGNTLAPQVIAEKNGAEILRLWAASSDFTEDLRIGQDILKANVEAYRRLRNTIRFLLANLAGFDEKERIGIEQMPELERFMLARLAEIDAQVREGYAGFDFNRVTATLFNFLTNEVSAFYFDIRKDALYCDPAHAPRRRAARTVMDEIFRRVVTWFAPILCFTMEEAWLSRFPSAESVHLETFFEIPRRWADPKLIEKWKRIRELRRVVTGALELERAAKTIGASLEAAPTVYVVDKADAVILKSVPFEEIAITSGIGIVTGEAPGQAFSLPDVKGVAVIANLSPGAKCERCWRVLPEVGGHKDHPHLCNRCDDAVAKSDPAVSSPA
ncbi:MAG: isoleucine--tRNA ligase [Alphaproteobacteria bacterium]|nr:isoleucine--tRNA ligase [Alphaproteobacteria bacterium]